MWFGCMHTKLSNQVLQNHQEGCLTIKPFTAHNEPCFRMELHYNDSTGYYKVIHSDIQFCTMAKLTKAATCKSSATGYRRRGMALDDGTKVD